MKYCYFFLLLLLYSSVQAQENEEKPQLEFHGYVKYDIFLDTYESVDTRDGMMYFYPKPSNPDVTGKDINENLQLEMLSLTTRFKLSITGPTVLGAQTNGYIESDFYGTSQEYTRMLRLRHAYFKFKWDSEFEVLMGQYWHPMFVTESYPDPLTYAIGLPLYVLNRSSQLRFTYPLSPSITIVSAFLVHGYHNSKGPREAQRNAGLPDTQLQLKFNREHFFFALTGGYKFLKPRTVTDDGIKTDEMANGLNLGGSFKVSYDAATFKWGAIYGENLTHFVMIGGLGASQDPSVADDYGYASMQTYSCWTDMHSNGPVRFGFLAGLTENLGSKDPYYSLGYERGEDLHHVYTLSPRISYHEKNFSIGFEYKYTAAVYGITFNEHHKAIETDDATVNNRFLISAKYGF